MILRQRAEEIVNLVDKTELEIMSTDSHLKVKFILDQVNLTL